MDDSDERDRMPWWSRAAGKILIAAVAVALVAGVAVAKFSGQVRSAFSGGNGGISVDSDTPARAQPDRPPASSQQF